MNKTEFMEHVNKIISFEAMRDCAETGYDRGYEEGFSKGIQAGTRAATASTDMVMEAIYGKPKGTRKETT